MSDCEVDWDHNWTWGEEPLTCECFWCETKAVIVPATGTFIVIDGEVLPAVEEPGHGGRLYTREVP